MCKLSLLDNAPNYKKNFFVKPIYNLKEKKIQKKCISVSAGIDFFRQSWVPYPKENERLLPLKKICEIR